MSLGVSWVFEKGVKSASGVEVAGYTDGVGVRRDEQLLAHGMGRNLPGKSYFCFAARRFGDR